MSSQTAPPETISVTTLSVTSSQGSDASTIAYVDGESVESDVYSFGWSGVFDHDVSDTETIDETLGELLTHTFAPDGPPAPCALRRCRVLDMISDSSGRASQA